MYIYKYGHIGFDIWVPICSQSIYPYCFSYFLTCWTALSSISRSITHPFTHPHAKYFNLFHLHFSYDLVTRAGMFSSCLRLIFSFYWEKQEQVWTSRLFSVSLHISPGQTKFCFHSMKNKCRWCLFNLFDSTKKVLRTPTSIFFKHHNYIPMSFLSTTTMTTLHGP
jgi:hypothetical protein